MKAWLASRLHALANRLYSDERTERVEVHDEYDICRCRIETHGIDRTSSNLPEGWHLWVDEEQYD